VAGTYSFTAVAYDFSGARATSSAVSVTVLSPSSTVPKGVRFHASSDHSKLVHSYRLDVFASNANPKTAKPIATKDLGKPTPDSTGNITSTQPTLFSALKAGRYLATVSAIGSAGTSRSASVAFSR
jgi:hypothetical protein